MRRTRRHPHSSPININILTLAPPHPLHHRRRAVGATMRTSLRTEADQTASSGALPIYATNERESVRADEGVGWEADAGPSSVRRTWYLVLSSSRRHAPDEYAA